ncbi:MAG TPA: hypothetical protein VK191_05810 [Symbiobacteriaceae bacterium]|nr:hypothetical protein [Symbiobacteriaceae bacterium]
MAEMLQVLTTWPEALERYLVREVLSVDASRVRLPRSLEVGLVWEKGRVRGTVDVPGGRFLVTLRVKPLADRAWKWAIERLARRPEANQAILAGRLDPAVLQVFEEASASLFVSATRRVECTCKGERDCRHRLAMVAQMAAEAAENPFLWFTVLGREREQFLAALRVTLMEELPEGDEGALDRERFWAASGRPAEPWAPSGRSPGDGEAAVPSEERSTQAGATLVDQLGPFPLVDGPMLVANRGGRLMNYRSLTEFLQLYAHQVAEGAKALQTGALIIPAAPPTDTATSGPAERKPPARPTSRKRRSGRRYR